MPNKTKTESFITNSLSIWHMITFHIFPETFLFATNNKDVSLLHNIHSMSSNGQTHIVNSWQYLHLQLYNTCVMHAEEQVKRVRAEGYLLRRNRKGIIQRRWEGERQGDYILCTFSGSQTGSLKLDVKNLVFILFACTQESTIKRPNFIHSNQLIQRLLFCTWHEKHIRLLQYGHGISIMLSASHSLTESLTLFSEILWHVPSEQKVKLLQELEREQISLSNIIDCSEFQ